MLKVDSAGQIGQLVRRRRKEAGMTLKDAAALAGVGVRFLSELERGKPTLQLGLAIGGLKSCRAPKRLRLGRAERRKSPDPCSKGPRESQPLVARQEDTEARSFRVWT